MHGRDRECIAAGKRRLELRPQPRPQEFLFKYTCCSDVGTAMDSRLLPVARQRSVFHSATLLFVLTTHPESLSRRNLGYFFDVELWESLCLVGM